MQDNSKNYNHIIVITTCIWLVGLYVGNRILFKTDNLYPFISENVLNPNYSEKFNEFMRLVMVGWTVICFFFGYFWAKAKN